MDLCTFMSTWNCTYFKSGYTVLHLQLFKSFIVVFVYCLKHALIFYFSFTHTLFKCTIILIILLYVNACCDWQIKCFSGVIIIECIVAVIIPFICKWALWDARSTNWLTNRDLHSIDTSKVLIDWKVWYFNFSNNNYNYYNGMRSPASQIENGTEKYNFSSGRRQGGYQFSLGSRE